VSSILDELMYERSKERDVLPFGLAQEFGPCEEARIEFRAPIDFEACGFVVADESASVFEIVSTKVRHVEHVYEQAIPCETFAKRTIVDLLSGATVPCGETIVITVRNHTGCTRVFRGALIVLVPKHRLR
jgi:hypothetical protein